MTAIRYGAGIVVLVIAAALSLTLLPNWSERLAWEWQKVYASTRRAILKPPETLPTPALASAAPVATEAASLLAVTPTQLAEVTATPAAALPAEVELTGFTQVWQRPNNCGPATLAMALGYWGWKGTQANTANALKPDPHDVNVNPDELAAYARRVGLAAEVRLSGTPEQLKALVAAGLPVIVETRVELPDSGWEGHYTLISGYTENKSLFTAQDALRGPNFIIPQAQLQADWQAFNYLYVVIYPGERQAQVQALLGLDADPKANAARAVTRARQDLAAFQAAGGAAQAVAFAWFNLGSSLAAQGDFAGASAAYDQARVAQLPWRMLWYQARPLEAYFRVGRYQDVIDLATTTLAQADNVEEMHYWRGRARLALGDKTDAVVDWQTAARYNRNYPEPAQALAELGLTP